MISEILFGESFSVIEESGSWKKIQLTHDGYEGWIDLMEVYPEWKDGKYGISKNPIFIDGHRISVGSFLINADANSLLPAEQKLPIEELEKVANQFLSTPYLWGGRTIWGIDCSGFTQIIARLGGQNIPRDAHKQAEIGKEVPFNAAQQMDLAFFKNENGRITHVGFVLLGQRIIHASEKVRIDHFDETGILRKSLGKYTHSLSHIRRIF